ncbi:hypothetical protein L7F22_064360 [Adiantum nelumboides]|nr:hypothetical protein [Adiantum nelumboides]
MTKRDIVDAYCEKFWSAFLPASSFKKISFREQIERFTLGLPTEIRDHCLEQKSASIQELMSHAKRGFSIHSGSLTYLTDEVMIQRDEPISGNESKKSVTDLDTPSRESSTKHQITTSRQYTVHIEDLTLARRSFVPRVLASKTGAPYGIKGHLAQVTGDSAGADGRDSGLLEIPYLYTDLGRVLRRYVAQFPSYRLRTAWIQGAARLYGSSLSSDNIINISGVVSDNVVCSLLQACKTGLFDQAQKAVTDIIHEGYPVSQILSQLYDLVVPDEELSDLQKARICERIAQADKCLIDGADEYLQMLDVASGTMRSFCNMPQESSFE